MNIFEKIVTTVVGLIILALVCVIGLYWDRWRHTPIGYKPPVEDTTTVKKQLEKPIIETGQIVATVDNCKMYRLKMNGESFSAGGHYLVWTICFDDKGKGISTSVTTY